MTDSAEKREGKRERLIAGARELVHEQGVQRTSLAEVANVADVPPGNVYYYFKTKDELVDAVVASYAADVEPLLAQFERPRTPAGRLKALVRHWVEMKDDIVVHGCPMGSLACELGKLGAPAAARAFAPILAWAERQFRELGARRPRDLALALLSGIQGAALLANAFGDSDVLVREGRHLEAWIDTVAAEG